MNKILFGLLLTLFLAGAKETQEYWIVKRFSDTNLYIAKQDKVYCFTEDVRVAHHFSAEKDANDFIDDFGLDVSWRAEKEPRATFNYAMIFLAQSSKRRLITTRKSAISAMYLSLVHISPFSFLHASAMTAD